MKKSSHLWVGITTVLLVIVTIMSVMNFPFNWVFYSTVTGQILVVMMVYNVLRDKYTSKQTFDDFYEDNPINNRLN